MRVVLDTNILISACLTRGGLEAQTVKLVQENVLTMCVSSAIWREYEEVLSREKFRAIHEHAAALLSTLRTCALFAEPETCLDVASDEDDNRMLECASASGARYLITGNLRHFPAMWGEARVVNAREFLTAECGLIPA